MVARTIATVVADTKTDRAFELMHEASTPSKPRRTRS
jgi:hypothetical protein